MTKTDFYCRNCNLDQTREAVKKGIKLYGSEWWEAPCENCNKRLVRRITERNLDPYLYESVKLKIERKKHAKDIIQKDSSLFKRYYPQQWAEDEKNAERRENSFKKEKTSRDEFMKETHAITGTKSFARQTIKEADKIANKPYGTSVR